MNGTNLPSHTTNQEVIRIHKIVKITMPAAAFGLLVLLAYPAGAIIAGDRNGLTPPDGQGGMGISAHLDHLESLGFDTSTIRAAIDSGDLETAHTLMQAFMDEHRDELPTPPAGINPGQRCHMNCTTRS